MSATSVRIGSRGSALARIQAGIVRDALVHAGHRAEIVVLETAGDTRAPDTAWGEGAFVGAIEVALREGRVDVAVHSAKDVPTDEDPALRIAAYLPRGDARDALVVAPGIDADRLDGLPIGARVGTDSPRRAAFLAARRPDLEVRPLHGNVDSRLRRLDAGEVDALILACAGLDRLGRSDRIAERLDIDVMPPAPGQGAIAVQIRSDDMAVERVVGGLDDAPTRAAVTAERAFLRATGGGCRAPVGAIATVTASGLELRGLVADADGSRIVTGWRRGTAGEPTSLGRSLAVDLGLAVGRDRRDSPAVHAPRVIVTRPVRQAGDTAAALIAIGLDPVLVPAVEIEFGSTSDDVDRVAQGLHAYRWAVVTSANGATAILSAATRVHTALGAPAWAAIGTATRRVLEDAGIEVAFAPTTATAAAIADELPVVPGDPVVVVRGDLAGGATAATLRARGADVDDVIAYRTLEAPESSRAALRAALGTGTIAAVVFTSGSSVRGLCALADTEGVEIKAIPAVCIGETTAEVARDVGFTAVIVAEAPDSHSIARAALATVKVPAEVAR